MEITYRLHDSQLLVFNDPARFVILNAGRRFGKTILAVVKLLTSALQTEKARVWYVAPTYKQAKEIAWARLLELTPKILIKKKNEVDLKVTLVNESEISLKGCDNEDSLRGVGLEYAVLDEYAMIKPNVFPEIIRPMLTDTQGKALFISTPKGKNHFWELFNQGAKRGETYSSYCFKTEDNPFIPRSEIKDAKEQLNERYFRQEYLASFEDYTGLVWPEFSYDLHTCDPYPVPDYFETFGVIDPATTGTTAVLFISVDEDGNLLVTDEYYRQNVRVSEVSEAIKGRASRWICDPAGKHKFNNREGKLYSFFDEFADNGIYLTAAQNDVEAGINRTGEYLKANKIKIFRRCENLLKELQVYHWADERETMLGVSKPQPFKSFDHACDCLRYAVMSRPWKSEKAKEKPKSWNTVTEWERQEELQHARDDEW